MADTQTASLIALWANSPVLTCKEIPMARRVCCALILALLFVSGSLAYANSGKLLTFQGLKDQQQVGNYDGVDFSSNFYGLVSVLNGGSGNFARTPTGTPAIFINGPVGSIVTGTINVISGFTGIQFFYTAAFQETVKIWSGANGSGTLLATINLSPNNGRCGSPAYCNWTSAGVSFSGTAESVTVTGGANGLGLADITLNSSKTAIPEPSSIYLLGIGFVGVGVSGIRRWLSS
jgi:hypothetical protein